MAQNWISVSLFAVFITLVTGQMQCPYCTDKYDPDSCTKTQDCGVGWNFCELLVHTSDYYSVEYVCQNYADCRNHELYGCHPDAHETCFYCCEEEVTCRLQRDDLFRYVFPNIRPPTPAPTTPVPTLPPITQDPGHPPTTQDPGLPPTTQGPGADHTFQCPLCSDPYNHETCLGTQSCFSDSFDTCELQVDTSDRNRAEYSCQKFSDCKNHETFGCHPLQVVCSYCCLDPVACKLQRDELFEFVFPPVTVTLGPARLPPASNATTPATVIRRDD